MPFTGPLDCVRARSSDDTAVNGEFSVAKTVPGLPWKSQLQAHWFSLRFQLLTQVKLIVSRSYSRLSVTDFES